MKPILVVDDEAIVRDSIKDWLQETGYQVATAGTGEEALAMIEKHDFSVLILDVRLPGKSGITVLREAKASKPDIKAIMITAYPTKEIAAESKSLGVIDYLVKPIFPKDIEDRIRETLAKWDANS